MIFLRRSSIKRAWSVLAVASLVFASGCKESSTCTASGKVLVDGQPAEGVYIVFHGADQSTTRSNSDGSFSLDINAPGDSIVTAFWPTITIKGVETIEGPDRLRGFYRDASHPATRVTIQAGQNDLPPISLTNPARGKSRANVRR